MEHLSILGMGTSYLTIIKTKYMAIDDVTYYNTPRASPISLQSQRTRLDVFSVVFAAPHRTMK